MYTITMHVAHGQVVRSAEAAGRYPHEAFTALLQTPIGEGYGPSSNHNRVAVLSSLARFGKAEHGWADYRMEYEEVSE